MSDLVGAEIVFLTDRLILDFEVQCIMKSNRFCLSYHQVLYCDEVRFLFCTVVIFLFHGSMIELKYRIEK